MATAKQWLLAGPTFGRSLRGGKKDRGPTEGDIARQRDRDQLLLNQFLAQLVPGSAEFQELQSRGQEWLSQIGSGPDFTAMIRDLGTQLASQQSQRIAAGGPATPFEARTNAQSQALRAAAAPQPFEEDIFRALEGTAPTTAFGRTLQESLQTTPEEIAVLAGLRGDSSTAPTADVISQIVARARTPDQFFESTLAPELDLARQAVESQFARRGITPTSGLAIEGLGRAGAELAVRSAQAKERSRQEALQNFLDALMRGQSATERRFGTSRETFNVGEQLRQRQLGTEQTLLDLQLGRENRLTPILAEQTFQRGTQQQDRFANLSDQATALEQQERAAKAQQAQQIARLLGTGVGFAVGGPTGASVGNQLVGAALPSGSPTSVASLIGQQQQTSQPIEGLSRAYRGEGPEAQYVQDLFERFPQRRRGVL